MIFAEYILTHKFLPIMKKNFLIAAFLIVAVIQLNAQNNQKRIPLIGDDAPSFKAKTTLGNINFPKDYGTSWKIIFSHPKDFTPVCSSELLELAQQQTDYDKLGVKILVLSTDLLSQHNDWVRALEEIKYKDRSPVKIKFPLIDDSDYAISHKYGMIHPSVNIAENIRAVFIIDPNNKIRSINFYPMEIGRNTDEIKRTILALQTVDANKNHNAPANWKPGEPLLVSVLTDAERNSVNTPGSDIIQLSWFMNFRLVK